MSRFFVTGYTSDSSSEEEDLLSTSEDELLSSSSEEEESTDSEFENDSEEESSDDEDVRPTGPAYFLKKSFLKGATGGDDSDSDDEGKRVVKSAKDKLLDEMKKSIELINTDKRTNNWQKVLVEFDKLGRSLIRATQQQIGTPNFFIKFLVGLDDYINETNDNEKETKTLNAAEARAFNTTRQRVKKQIKEFQYHFDLYKTNPDVFDQDDEEVQQKKVQATTTDGSGEGVKVMSPVFATLKQISETRGKKNIDKFEQIEILEELLEKYQSGTPFELISIYQMLLSIRFDAGSLQTYMSIELWQKNQQDLLKLLQLLESKISSYQLSEAGHVTDDIDIEPTANETGVKVIFGSIISSIDRLDDEFIKSLQNIDPHSIEYVERLKDEITIYNLIVRGQAYIESITESGSSSEQLGRIVLTRLEHIYYKPNQLIKLNEEEVWKNIQTDSKIVARNSTPTEVINGLANYLINQSANTIYGDYGKLYSIYHYAVNNDYNQAIELFSNYQFYNSINNHESSLQVQYNRVLVQLGISAFRSGQIEESHKILNEIVQSQRSKELLGQGFISKYSNQITNQERAKLLPFHQHINLELLDCVYSTSCLLIEIPQLASTTTKDNTKRKSSIKSFKSKLEFHDRQFFTGPPESIKDHIIHASIALTKGDWLKSYELLSSIKIWKLLPDFNELFTMLRDQLQVEGLRTYIFNYKSIYCKLSLDKLSKIFQLSSDRIKEILEKMIELDDINGEFNQVEDKWFINFITNEPRRSKLQELAIVMNEKVGLLAEKNDKTGSNGYGKKQPQQQQQQQQTPQQTPQPQTQQQQQQQQLGEEQGNRFRYANVNSNNDEFQATF
ncbi:Eukaryotic translation initiation factor 3 subunit C [Spathaspora sp. JA1]|nr:Eukaryotic translation initiation factor 3 subunit C [Spathaspora sp. JA1]